MLQLIIVTLIWAFSFSLIGEFLAGNVDSYFSAWSRMTLALVVFSPWLFKSKEALAYRAKVAVIGAIQLGVMYLFYFKSFEYLAVPEVLLFTIFTPIYVALFAEALERRFNAHHLFWAMVSVIGAYVIRQHDVSSDALIGFFIVQGANLCFAAGQVAYRHLNQGRAKLIEPTRFADFFVGAFVISTIAWLLFGSLPSRVSPLNIAILIWLGVVASGIGYFLWNAGGSKVSTGTLAAMNNALIPAGLVVNLIFWNKPIDLITTSVGGAIIIFAVVMDQRQSNKQLQDCHKQDHCHSRGNHIE